MIIDGDHNYYTVSEELRLIDERAPGARPLLMLHDVGWPHGRRDAYWTPERIPEEHRQPMVERPFIFPGEPGVVDAGMPMYAAAEREGGAGNGVLTALEDFLDRRGDLRLAVLPPFFGFAVAGIATPPGRIGRRFPRALGPPSGARAVGGESALSAWRPGTPVPRS